jgi:hypothetical protein
MSEEFPHELPNVRVHTTSYTSPLLPIRGGADGPAGLLLGIQPASISYVSSVWDKGLKQNVLRIHLNNGHYIRVFESDAAETLETLGLNEFVEDWTLNLERDLG